MYEQFKNELLVALDGKFTCEQLTTLSHELDNVAKHYNIEKIDTALARIDDVPIRYREAVAKELETI